MAATDLDGLSLARAYSAEVVEPLLAARWPGLPRATGRLGTGSEVLGLDDDVSRDHDWGLRLCVFVPDDAVAEVDATLERLLPDSFRGLPVRFALSGATEVRHRVEVSSVTTRLLAGLGFDPRAAPTARDWLSVSGQAALEIVAGAVFTDVPGQLTAARRSLAWYPDDLWRYVLACDWIRIGQELPLMGRAADAGDDPGSRVIAARLVHAVMHLTFLLERRWPPYAKWFGTRFAALDGAERVGPAVAAALRADDAADRQAAVALALEPLLLRQHVLGLTTARTATVPFWDRPYRHPDPSIAAQLLDGITDPEVRALPRGRGSVEQRTDAVDVLVDVAARRAAVAV